MQIKKNQVALAHKDNVNYNLKMHNGTWAHGKQFNLVGTRQADKSTTTQWLPYDAIIEIPRALTNSKKKKGNA